MVTYDELVKLAQMSQNNLGLQEQQLIDFVKAGAVRAYRAGGANRDKQDVSAEFNAQTKELRLIVRKKVVAVVSDDNVECLQSAVQQPIGASANIEVIDKDTYEAIDAAVAAIKRQIQTQWKKENSLLIKTKFQEFKNKCLSGIVSGHDANDIRVNVGGVEALLPYQEQLWQEKHETGAEIVVFVVELRQDAQGEELIVSRKHPSLVAYAMRRHIVEVDAGNIEIKAIARIGGKRSRVAVWSKDFAPTDRCAKRANKVSAELGGEIVEFVEWYPETKSFIASALKAEAREVHLIEGEKQALVEVFKDSAEQDLNPQEDVLLLAQQLTGYKIEIKLVPRTDATKLPGL